MDKTPPVTPEKIGNGNDPNGDTRKPPPSIKGTRVTCQNENRNPSRRNDTSSKSLTSTLMNIPLSPEGNN